MSSSVEDSMLDNILEKWSDANNGNDFIVQLDELYQMYPNKNELAKYNLGIKTVQHELTVSNLEHGYHKELLSDFLGYRSKRHQLPDYSSFEKTVIEKLTELLHTYKPDELKELPNIGYNYIMSNAMDGNRYTRASNTILQYGLSGVYST